MIYGERSNGKSYQVKHKKAVEKYLKTGKRFILMRRLREEITSEKIEQYFQDVDVAKLTEGKYNPETGVVTMTVDYGGTPLSVTLTK